MTRCLSGLVISSVAIWGLAACGEVAAPVRDDVIDATVADAALADAAIPDATPPDAAVTGMVAISPAEPLTDDPLVASITAGDPGDFTFQWKENGVVRADLTTDTVPAAETAKAEVWTVELVAVGTSTVVGTDDVTILNTAPTAPVASISPATVAAGTSMRCLIDTPATDADGDEITYSATWTENGAAYAGATTNSVFAADTIPAASTQIDDSFVCTAIAFDGTASATMTTAPRVVSCVTGGTTTFNPTTEFSYTGTIRTFTVPANVCSIRITAAGAKGGDGNSNGAVITGTFAVTGGTQFKVLVGARPQQGSLSYVLAGGGGSFVTTMANAPRVIAGGGGSCFSCGGAGTISDAELQGRAVTSGGTAGTTVRADNGAGGNTGFASSAGGGGLTGNGASAGGGLAFVNGGNGGNNLCIGGFGGGGARSGANGQGGGGGYSGGSCGETGSGYIGCGGGGSYNGGTSQVNTAGSNAGAGYVTFTW